MAIKQYFGVGGVARNVKGWNFGVNGVARTVVSGYEGVEGVARQFLTTEDSSLPPKGMPLENYTWDEISAVSKSGLASQYWSIGDTKSWTYGTNVTMYAQIVGFDHDMVVNGSAAGAYGRTYAGITFELCGKMGTVPTTSNPVYSTFATTSYSYNSSTNTAFTNYSNSTLCNVVESIRTQTGLKNSGILNVVVPVWKKYRISATNFGEFEAVFFLPSCSELGGVNNGALDEGEQYSLYESYGLTSATTANTKRKRFCGSTSTATVVWWTRTCTSASKAYAINRTGVLSLGAFTNNACIAPMFCV